MLSGALRPYTTVPGPGERCGPASSWRVKRLGAADYFRAHGGVAARVSALASRPRVPPTHNPILPPALRVCT